MLYSFTQPVDTFWQLFSIFFYNFVKIHKIFAMPIPDDAAANSSIPGDVKNIDMECRAGSRAYLRIQIIQVLNEPQNILPFSYAIHDCLLMKDFLHGANVGRAAFDTVGFKNGLNCLKFTRDQVLPNAACRAL